jgi:hypothetical protein
VALFLAESGAANVTASAQVLTAAGWRIAVVPNAARLAAAWQEIYLSGGPSASGGISATAAAGVSADAPTVQAPTVQAPTGEASRG